MNCRSTLFSLSATLLASSVLIRPAAAATCESLMNAKLADSTITAAQSVPAGSYKAADGKDYANLPAFCRVAVASHPTNDSNIQYEVWLPASVWNGKFIAHGNGGFAGSIAYAAMAETVQSGYASASTDTGHTGGDGTFALGHPEKIIDFGYRAEHILAQQGQALVQAFYERKSAHAYFAGCSGGGRQAMVEAQRFPEDYDGIIAGDPAYNWTNHYVGAHLWLGAALYDSGPQTALSMGVGPIVGKAVDAACDALDGLKDGILTDPRRCKFNPAQLLCKAGQDPGTCLTPAQMAVVERYYAGPEGATYAGYYPKFDPGAEGSNWPGLLSSNDPYGGIHGRQGFPFFKYFVFDDANWDFHTWKWTKASADFVDNKQVVPGQTLKSVLNAEPDLAKFKARGGKMIHYHGFDDPDIPARNSINYHDGIITAEAKAGAKAEDTAQSYYRLFMVPAMGHCQGGPGPNVFDMVPALDSWVDKGVAPASVMATKFVDNKRTGAVQMTRPLCPYPQEAHYKGTGDTNVAASFSCMAPGK